MTLISKVIHGGLKVVTQGSYLGNITAEGSLTSVLNTTVGQNLYVNGTSDFTGLLTAGDALINALTVSTGLIVSAGGANITGDVDIVGDTEITGSLEVTDGGILFKVNSLGLQSDGDYVVLTNLINDASVTGQALFIDDVNNQVKRFDNLYSTLGAVYISGVLNVGSITGASSISASTILASTADLNYVYSHRGTIDASGVSGDVQLFTCYRGETYLVFARHDQNMNTDPQMDHAYSIVSAIYDPITVNDCVGLNVVLSRADLNIVFADPATDEIEVQLNNIDTTGPDLVWTAIRLV
jgi:hypothetical protein